jgi:hypothetical protein
MKVTKENHKLAFQPKAITILIETEEEYQNILNLTLCNVSIPDAVKNFAKEANKTIIENLLDSIHNSLIKP